MLVTNKLKMDLSTPDPSLSVNAVQGDAYSRNLSIALYNHIIPWTIPEGISAAVRYAKPDRTKGYYDTLPDGSSAWCVQENILTIWLAPQMLTVPGKVIAQIELIQGTHTLSTFGLIVHVEPNPAAGVLKSEDYINWLQWFQEHTKEHVLQVQQSAQEVAQTVFSAVQASEASATSAVNAAISADCAKNSSYQALDAAASAATSQKKTESLAEDIAVIIARNEAYTKQESDCRYSPSILETVVGELITQSDCTALPLQNLKIFGKTIQNAVPSPEEPVPLESVGNDGSILVTVGTSNMDENPQKMTVSTPNGLPGIPVTSGGNYTDVNGQQWICDEVDFTKGVYTQRIGVYTLDKTKTWTWNTMHSCSYAYVPGGKITDSVSQHERYVSSNRYIGTSWVRVGYTDAEYHCAFIYGISQVGFYDKDCTNVSEFLTKLGDNSIEVQYVLENPVETAISAEELAQYSNANLRTYYPSTTIFNDAGAGMEVKYIADTNLYIDKKFAELSTALLNQ